MISHLTQNKNQSSLQDTLWVDSLLLLTLLPTSILLLTLLRRQWLSCGFLNTSRLFLCWRLCVCYFLCLEGPFPTTSLTPSLHVTSKVWLSSMPFYKVTSLSFIPQPSLSIHVPLSGLTFFHCTFHHLTHVYTSLFSVFLNKNINSLKEGRNFYFFFPLLYTWHLEQWPTHSR